MNKIVIKYRDTRVTLEGKNVKVEDLVNNQNIDLTNSIDNQPYHTKHMYVKAATDKYRMVQAFGVKVLYDMRRAFYIYLNPFYINKVWLAQIHSFLRQ